MWPDTILSELQASQRATARMLGVSKSTINTDVQNRTPEKKIDSDNEIVINDTVQNRTLDEIPGWIQDSGQKDVIQQLCIAFKMWPDTIVHLPVIGCWQ